MLSFSGLSFFFQSHYMRLTKALAPLARTGDGRPMDAPGTVSDLANFPLLRQSAEARRAPPDERPTLLAPIDPDHFVMHRRPDGRYVAAHYAGEIMIPDVIAPGGVRLPTRRVEEPKVRFGLIGDTGEKGAEADAAAVAFNADHATRKNHFAVHAGDIFYPHGIKSPDDPLVAELWTKRFGKLAPTYAINGNHEYANSEDAGVPEAIGALAKSGKGGGLVKPADYYVQRYEFVGGSVDLFFLDTSRLVADPRQLAWIEKELAASSADWKLVIGHHAIHSGGLHGDSPVLPKLLLPLLERHAHAYFSGHEHDQQHLVSDKGLPMVVSGSGSESRATSMTQRSRFADGTVGYVMVQVDQASMKVEFIKAEDKSVMHSFTVAAKRAERPYAPRLPGLVAREFVRADRQRQGG